MFSQFKVDENRTEEKMSRFYINLQLRNSSSWFYEALSYQPRMQEFFFPNLVDLPARKSECYLFVTLNHYSYKNGNKKYPVVWTFEHFRKNIEVIQFPKSIKDLDENHFPLARTYLEVYPGGAGMRVR